MNCTQYAVAVVNILDPDGCSTFSQISKFDDMMYHLATTGICRQIIAVDKLLELFQIRLGKAIETAIWGCNMPPGRSRYLFWTAIAGLRCHLECALSTEAIMFEWSAR